MSASDRRVEAGADVRASIAPRVAVVICTRDRTHALARALASLVAQSDAPEEIIVVDNAPASEDTRRLVAERFPAVRYVREPVPGLDFARNRALRETRCDVVAFLDDDAVADAQWVRHVRAAFAADASLWACTGRIMPLSLATEAQRVFEANGGLFASADLPLHLSARESGWPRRPGVPLIVRAVTMGSGCNMAVRRWHAHAVGRFDEALDLGPALPGGGDIDMLWRLVDSGGRIRYESRAIVRHEHRTTLPAAYGQMIGHQRALVAMLVKSASRARGLRRVPILAFLGWRLIKPGVRLVRRAARRDPLPAWVLLRMWAACWAGLGAYPAARREAQRRRTAAHAAERVSG